jgi:membrane-bound ClpP family serine protease
MRPGAVRGAATPVDGQGTKAPEKMVSAMRAEFRALAEQRGLDPKLAEAMVDESVEIPGVVAKGQLLTLSTGEAVRLNFAKGPIANEDALLTAIGHPKARVVVTQTNWAEGIVRFLTNPLVSPLLLSIGILGLVFEIKTGAFGLGGLLSLVSLGLFFGSSLILGLAGWEEVLLLGLAAMMPIGIVIGALVPSTQKVGSWGMLPIMVLVSISGIFFPIQALWGWLQPVAQIFPLYWIGLGMRSAFLPDAALAIEVGQSWRTGTTIAVLAAWAVVGTAVCPQVLRRMARRQSGAAMQAAKEQATQWVR